MSLDKTIQNIIIVGLFVIVIHMLLGKKLLSEGFAQGELIPSGHSLYTQEAEE